MKKYKHTWFLCKKIKSCSYTDGVTVLQRPKKKKKEGGKRLNCVHLINLQVNIREKTLEVKAPRSRLYLSRLIHPEAVGWRHSQNHRSQVASTNISAAEPQPMYSF